MNDPGGHGGGYPPGAPPANELPSPGRPLKRRQVRTRMGGVGDVAHHLARAGQRSPQPGDPASTHPPPEILERAPTDQPHSDAARVPRSIDSHHVLEAVRADAGGQGPGLVVVVTHASGRERTEVFRSTEVSIGRDRNNDLCLTGDGISRRHALLTLGEDNSCTIIDLGSTNGTFVNEQPIENSPTELTQKDFVTLGEFALRVRPFGDDANVDPSTMQFDVPAAAVIVQHAQPAPVPAGGPLSVTAARPRTERPPGVAPSQPSPSVRRPREQHSRPPPALPANPQPAPAVPVAPAAHQPGPPQNLRTAEMRAEDFVEESDEGQGTAAMLDTSALADAAPQAAIAPPLVTSRRVSSAPPVRAPNAVEAEPLDIVNEHTVSEQQTRVKELIDLPPPVTGRSPVTEPPPAPVMATPKPPATVQPPGIVVTTGSPPGTDDAAHRPRVTPGGGAGLPQTGPRSRPLGEPSSKTPIGMPAPPGRPAAVIASKPSPVTLGAPPPSARTGQMVRPVTRPPPPPRSRPAPASKPPAQAQSKPPTQTKPPPRSKPASERSAAPAPRSKPAGTVTSAPSDPGRDEPSTGPDSIVVAGRVTTDSSAALEALLGDSDVTRVSVNVRRVDVERKGVSSPHDGFDFATEDGLVRAIARVCQAGGLTIDDTAPFSRGTLSDGWELFIVRAPAAPNGQLVQLTRLGSVGRSLDELRKEKWLSKPMVELLSQAFAARCNVLVVSERDDDADTVVRAIASAGDAPPLWVVRDANIAPKGHPAIILDPEAPDATLETCAELSVERVVLPKLRVDAWHALLRVVRRGREGMITRMRGPSLEAALDRTAAGLAAYLGEQQTAAPHAAASVATFRAWLGASLTLGIEVGRIRDGAPRVLRMSELSAGEPRDLFEFDPDPPPNGTFQKREAPNQLQRILAPRGHRR